MAKYTVCKKCSQRHSTLVRHKCPTKVAKRAETDCEITEHDFTEGVAGTDLSFDGEACDESKGETDSDGGGEGCTGEGEGGDGDGEGGEGEGDGEDGEEGDGDGEDGDGDGYGEDEREGRAPQLPEPETPPVVVVVTVLKFAALTAACAQNGVIEVTVSEDGLFVYGHNSDQSAHRLMPWGEFERRSTIDGEFYVKEVIDEVDGELIEAEFAEVDEEPVAKGKGGKAKAAEKKR